MNDEFYSIGVDLGSIYAKFIVINDFYEIIYKSIDKIGGDPEEVFISNIQKIVKELNLPKNSVYINITGRNGQNLLESSLNKIPKSINKTIKSIKTIPELNSMAKAAICLSNKIRTIVDIGGFSNKILKINDKGKIIDFIQNDICSSGSGIFLELICKALGLQLDSIDEYVSRSIQIIPISSQCSIFAESEVIYLLNENKNIENIVAGACKSITGRIIPLISKIGIEKEIILTGGIGKFFSIKKFLQEEIKLNFLDIKIDPIFFNSYGAAAFRL